MYNEKHGVWVEEVTTCNSSKELIKAMFDAHNRGVQCSLVEFHGVELIMEGLCPHPIDATCGDFVVANVGEPVYSTMVFLLGPVDEQKNTFNLFLFPNRFHIDQTCGIYNVPSSFREELIYWAQRAY